MNYQDFKTNASKFQKFKTAQIKSDIITHNGLADLGEGQTVGIRWAFDTLNKVSMRVEPVYRVFLPGCTDPDRNLFGSSLKNFGL